MINIQIDTQNLIDVITESFKEQKISTLECFAKTLQKCGFDLDTVLDHVQYEVCKTNNDHYTQIDVYKWHELRLAFAEFNGLLNDWFEHESYLGGFPDSDLVYHKNEIEAPNRQGPTIQLCVNGDFHECRNLNNNYGYQYADYLETKKHADKRLASVQGLEVSE